MKLIQNWMLLTRHNLCLQRYGFKLLPWHLSADDDIPMIRYHSAGWLCWQASWMWTPDTLLPIK